MKKVLPLFLALVLLSACFAPLAAADSGETRYVCSGGGVAAYLFSEPKLGQPDLIVDTVCEGAELTVLAERGEFYRVRIADGRCGWICKSQTAETRELLDSVPELIGSCWIYETGEGDQNTYAIRFDSRRFAEVMRVSKGAPVRWEWTISSRRVWIDGNYFVWDGEQFVPNLDLATSTKSGLSLRPDTEGLFDKLLAERG